MESKFLMNVYFEKRWEQPLSELHKELNIFPLKEEKEVNKKNISSTKTGYNIYFFFLQLVLTNVIFINFLSIIYAQFINQNSE